MKTELINPMLKASKKIIIFFAIALLSAGCNKNLATNGAANGYALEQDIKQIFAPNVIEYAKTQNIDLNKIASELNIKSVPENYSTSHAYINMPKTYSNFPNQTYSDNPTILVYDLKTINEGSVHGILALLSSSLPGEIVDLLGTNNPTIDWKLAFFDSKTKLISSAQFSTTIKYKNVDALWDDISAEIEDADLNENQTNCLNCVTNKKVLITYAHAGGGGAREQEFEAEFDITESKISLLGSRQISDGCGKANPKCLDDATLHFIQK